MIERIDLGDINYLNIASMLCGEKLTDEQKIDVLKLQISYDMATMHKNGIQDDFVLYTKKGE